MRAGRRVLTDLVRMMKGKKYTGPTVRRSGVSGAASGVCADDDDRAVDNIVVPRGEGAWSVGVVLHIDLCLPFRHITHAHTHTHTTTTTCVH